MTRWVNNIKMHKRGYMNQTRASPDHTYMHVWNIKYKEQHYEHSEHSQGSK